LGKDKKSSGGTGTKAPDKDVTAPDGVVGSALRTVYEKTVNEKIPDDLLDLLGKLQ
jgi:hypothetical protein